MKKLLLLIVSILLLNACKKNDDILPLEKETVYTSLFDGLWKDSSYIGYADHSCIISTLRNNQILIRGGSPDSAICNIIDSTHFARTYGIYSGTPYYISGEIVGDSLKLKIEFHNLSYPNGHPQWTWIIHDRMLWK